MYAKDKEIVLAAVQNDGDALYDAAEELQADKEIVLAAEQNNQGVKLNFYKSIVVKLPER